MRTCERCLNNSSVFESHLSNRTPVTKEYDYATCDLSPLPNVPSFELSTCFEYSRGNSFCTYNVDASGHAVHGMNKHARFLKTLFSHLQLFALWSQRAAEVATHVAMLVFWY